MAGSEPGAARLTRTPSTMRVFYDHQVTSLQDAGGASRYHYELLQHLQAARDVSATALLGGNRSVFPYSRLQGERARVYSWPARLSAGYARYAVNEAISTAMAPMQGKFDVYHASYYRALPFVRRQRLVVTHHDCVQERYPELFRNAASIFRVKRKLFRQADRIVCVSAASQADLFRFYEVDPERTEVIHHGFSPLRALPSSAPVRETVRPKAAYILYVGSRARYKNFSLLLEAYAGSRFMRDVRLQAVGGGAWSEEEQRHMAALGLRDRVDLVQQASEAELAELYRDAMLFVYPSLYEGFGFPPLEAMSEGCPALVSAASSLPEICGNAAFYFDPADGNDLKTALDRLLGDADLRSSKRLAGLEQAGMYSWATATHKTLRAYRRALESDWQ